MLYASHIKPESVKGMPLLMDADNLTYAYHCINGKASLHLRNFFNVRPFGDPRDHQCSCYVIRDIDVSIIVLRLANTLLSGICCDLAGTQTQLFLDMGEHSLSVGVVLWFSGSSSLVR